MLSSPCQRQRELLSSLGIRRLSSFNLCYFVPICYQTWPPQAFLVSDWPISKKYSHIKPLGQMNRNLVGSILGTSSIEIAYLVPISYQTWPPRQFLFLIGCFLKKNLPLWNRLAKWTEICTRRMFFLIFYSNS